MANTFTPTTFTKKFQRTYEVQVEAINGSTFTFGSSDGSRPLLTMEFNVIRNISSSVQTGNFRIRNINQNTRNNIFKDYYNISSWRSVVVKAGYVGTPLSTIFNGKANTIYSYRESGGTDWITEIEGTDFSGLFSNSWSSWTDGPPSASQYTQQNVITHLVSDLQVTAKQYGQTLGIGVVNGFVAPRYSYSANDFTMNLLAIESSRLVFIDNGQIFCMPSNYVFKGDVTLISSETGLLGTPRQQQTNLIAQMIFEPGLVPGQQVELDTISSEFSSSKNGLYKVVGVQHAGVISSTVDGKCITTVTLQSVSNIQQAPFGIYAQV